MMKACLPYLISKLSNGFPHLIYFLSQLVNVDVTLSRQQCNVDSGLYIRIRIRKFIPLKQKQLLKEGTGNTYTCSYISVWEGFIFIFKILFESCSRAMNYDSTLHHPSTHWVQEYLASSNVQYVLTIKGQSQYWEEMTFNLQIWLKYYYFFNQQTTHWIILF